MIAGRESLNKGGCFADGGVEGHGGGRSKMEEVRWKR